jgi:hypothetical protein
MPKTSSKKAPTLAEMRALEAIGGALREKAETLLREIKLMDFELKPGWERERSLKERISATHGGPAKFNRARAPERAPLFEGLTEIAVQYGAKRAERTSAKSQLNAYINELKRMKKQRDQMHGALSAAQDELHAQ